MKLINMKKKTFWLCGLSNSKAQDAGSDGGKRFLFLKAHFLGKPSIEVDQMPQVSMNLANRQEYIRPSAILLDHG